MKEMSLLIKPASSACQLNCSYCFYKDVSHHRRCENNGIMSYEVCVALIHKVCNQIEDSGTITFAFQGGEPLLAGLPYFQQFCKCVNQEKKPHQTIQYAIQTNGCLLDDAWCEFFRIQDFLVGISLDGYAQNHDGFRKDAKGKGSHKQALRAIALLKKYQIPFNILTVLTRQLANHPDKLYRFYQEHNLMHIQLIPCLADLDKEETAYALTPQRFASFYKPFFDLWIKELPTQYRSISLFDNLLRLLQDQLPAQCGMFGRCFMQMVIESDGSVYPCDFYVLDEHSCGNILQDDLETIMHHPHAEHFMKQGPLGCRLCPTCPYQAICHGNCKRSSDAYYRDNYCGYKDFLDYSMPRLYALLTKPTHWRFPHNMV